MTPDDMEQAAAAFVDRVQAVGTGPALDEIEDAVRGRTYEEIARKLYGIGEPWAAEWVRRWRWER